MHPLKPEEINRLVAACQRNDRRAQKQLYEWMFGGLLAVTMRYAGDAGEARSLLNQAFLRIFRELPKYEPGRPFLPWAKAIVIHTVIDQYRKKAVYEKHLTILREQTGTENRAWNEALNNLATEEIHRCIQQLPDDARVVFSLYEIEGYTHGEIAELLAIPEGTSRWHLSNAKRLLRRMLRPFVQFL